MFIVMIVLRRSSLWLSGALYVGRSKCGWSLRSRHQHRCTARRGHFFPVRPRPASSPSTGLPCPSLPPLHLAAVACGLSSLGPLLRAVTSVKMWVQWTLESEFEPEPKPLLVCHQHTDPDPSLQASRRHAATAYCLIRVSPTPLCCCRAGNDLLALPANFAA